MSALARRYARALFEVAQEQGAIDAVASDLRVLHESMSDEGIRSALQDPSLPRGWVGAALSKVGSGAHPLTNNLISVVSQRRREALLPDLHTAFDVLARQAKGEVRGVVETARELAADEVAALEAKTSAAIGQKVSLEPRVADELIGGVRIRVGNTLYDGSVATALEDLERRLKEAPLP